MKSPCHTVMFRFWTLSKKEGTTGLGNYLTACCSLEKGGPESFSYPRTGEAITFHDIVTVCAPLVLHTPGIATAYWFKPDSSLSCLLLPQKPLADSSPASLRPPTLVLRPSSSTLSGLQPQPPTSSLCCERVWTHYIFALRGNQSP